MSAEPSFVQVIRRPKREDAIAFARETFLAGERVDLGELSERLGVNRTTLQRWIGTREKLLDEVLSQLAVEIFDAVAASTTGSGAQRLIQLSEPMVQAFTRFEPARTFVEREPQLALHLFLSDQSAIHQRMSERVLQVMDQPRTAAQKRAHEELSHTIVQVSTGMVWTTLAIGEQAPIKRAVQAIKALVQTAGA